MERGHERNADVLPPLATKSCDGRVGPEQRLSRELPQRHDDRWADGVQLRLEEGLAGGDLVRLRVAVSRRAALHDVADVDLVAAVPHRGDHLRQQLSRRADEGDALVVLLGAGTLADEDQPGLRISHAEDEVLRPRAELAALA